MGNATHLAKKKQDSSKLKTLIIGAVVVLAIVAVIGLNVYNIVEDSGYFQRKTVAIESESYTLTTADMQYYYNTQYQNFVNTWSSYGLDISSYINTSLSLKSQQCAFSSGQSWFEYFMTSAKSYATELICLCEAAKAEGLALDEDELKEIADTMDALDATAKKAGYSTKNYIAYLYGAAVNEEIIERSMEMELLANKYTSKYVDAADVSDKVLEDKYTKDPDKYDTVDYIAFTFDYSDLLEDDDKKKSDDKDDKKSLTKEEAVKIATEAAKRLAKSKDVESFNDGIVKYLVEHLGYTEEKAKKEITDGTYVLEDVNYDKDDAVVAWAFKAKKGEITNIAEVEDHEHSSDTSKDNHADLEKVYTVAILTRARGRDENISSRDVRHILFKSTTYADDTKVKEIYDQWVADGAKVSDFEALAAEYSEDTGSAQNGGLYEGVTEGQMVDEFNDWLFDEKREVGDHEIVKTKSYGWHIMYYAGGIEGWKSQIKNEIQEDAYNKAFDAAVDAHDVTVHNSALDEVDG